MNKLSKILLIEIVTPNMNQKFLNINFKNVLLNSLKNTYKNDGKIQNDYKSINDLNIKNLYECR